MHAFTVVPYLTDETILAVLRLESAAPARFETGRSRRTSCNNDYIVGAARAKLSPLT